MIKLRLHPNAIERQFAWYGATRTRNTKLHGDGASIPFGLGAAHNRQQAGFVAEALEFLHNT